MQSTVTHTYATPVAGAIEGAASAVSWAAVIAGAVIAAALSAMLMVGGTGLGFLSVSPWESEGASGTALAIGTIVWLFAVQIIAYGVAGYVTGRLRTRWTGVHGDEVYFRDTAHGLLVWALSAVISVMVVGSAVSSVVSGTAKAGASLVGAGAGAAAAAVGVAGQPLAENGTLDYFTDTLLRGERTGVRNRDDARQEVSRIVARSLAEGQVSQADRTYLTGLVAEWAGIERAEAERRIDEAVSQAKQAAEDAERKVREAADAARKAAAAFAMWAFASLLIGAFVASVGALVGGRARDR